MKPVAILETWDLQVAMDTSLDAQPGHVAPTELSTLISGGEQENMVGYV